jgi:hypothetical protein
VDARSKMYLYGRSLVEIMSSNFARDVNVLSLANFFGLYR